jgi:predicted PhzF superfamily epimerase YddE/YHI9
MTIRVPFYVVDVFASQPLTGSPLPLLPDADGLDEAQLRAIAREFSQPETTFLHRAGGEGCYLYSRDAAAADAVAYARFFNPTMGIAEDPATGSAAGPLAARLAAAGQIPHQATVVIEQGHALGRPSRIQVEVSGPRIRVGGSGLVVAEGTLSL